MLISVKTHKLPSVIFLLRGKLYQVYLQFELTEKGASKSNLKTKYKR